MNYSYDPNYILPTETIRANYIYDSLWPELDGAEFDRWLAFHDAEIRADEREQAERRVLALAASSRWSVPLLLMVKRAAAAARGKDNTGNRNGGKSEQ